MRQLAQVPVLSQEPQRCLGSRSRMAVGVTPGLCTGLRPWRVSGLLRACDPRRQTGYGSMARLAAA